MALTYHDVYGSPWDLDPERPEPVRDPTAVRARLSADAPEVPGRFKKDDRARLRDDLGGGVVKIVDTYHSADLFQVRPESGKPDFVVSSHALTKFAPTWRPGDVIVVTFGHGPRPNPAGTYTYVRGRESWPTDAQRPPKTDEWVTRMYLEGRVRPVLQAGGEPFDGGRP
ncbi:hypothetical protein [Micromonospora sp. KC213]|uniref:hypothetical protein n=1 Tax=Micromonospora sp. KC213 TaxID=2530378 RepID=UPI001043A130|nr:hypothetical protein [Micromonospora sp. KC213]TDC35723.1 hypothetical protein E1166_23290 [Micromonospora sp. KC213]